MIQRAPYTPAQLADIARRGRKEGWRRVDVFMRAGEFHIAFSDEPAPHSAEPMTVEEWFAQRERSAAGDEGGPQGRP